MNMGPASEPDIFGRLEVTGETLSCEVFASVDPNNNRKLTEDITRVSTTDADLKYVMFFSPSYMPGFLKERCGVKLYVVALSVHDHDELKSKTEPSGVGETV